MNSPVDSVTIHEGYLYKTPPLDNFFMSWKKRWFVLSRTNPSDSSSLDLSYYSDCEKKDKKGSIDFLKMRSVNPVYNKSNDNVFSVEMVDRKFMLKSPDKQGKAVWVAKLLECCSKDGTSYHVTIPDQPTVTFAEGILKLTTPLRVNVLSSLNGAAALKIPFDRIRRFGCQISYNYDIVWFETCSCQNNSEDFIFFTIASGIERAYQIVQEYKRAIEVGLREHVIMEQGDQAQFLYSYVVKAHYGHTEFPSVGRERIMQSSLMSLSSSGGSLSLSDLNKFSRARPSLSVDKPVPGDLSKSKYSRSESIGTSLSPGYHGYQQQGGRLSLDQVKRSPRNSRANISASADFDSGVSVDEPFDPSRHSAPCDLNSSAPASMLAGMRKQKMTLADMKERRISVDQNPKSRRVSLAQLQNTRALSMMGKDESVDSAHGSTNDLPPYAPRSPDYTKMGGGKGGVSPSAAYDLADGVRSMSVKSTGNHDSPYDYS